MRGRLLVGGALIIAVLVFGGMGGLYYWATQPAVSSSVSNSSGAAVMGEKIAIHNTKLTTKFFSTKINDAYVQREHTDRLSAGILDRYLFVSPVEAGSDQVAVTIGALPADGLRGISDVVFRQRNPDVYEPIAVGPAGSVAFVSEQAGYEVSVFMSHDGMYAAVVLSGRPDRQAEIYNQLTTMVADWRWL